MTVKEANHPSAHAGMNDAAGRSGLPLIAMASAALGLLLVSVMLAYSRYGYDFTDEGFYLVRISDPFADAPAVSQFGIVFYPFYRLFDGSIVGLRQFNLLVTFFSSFSLFMITTRQQAKRITEAKLLLVSLGIASISLLVIASLLVTPNYNSLVLQGLILAAIGLVLAQPETHPSSVAGWLLIGFGGWLAFLAKPPSAALLAVLAVIYLVVMRKLRLPLVLIAIVFAILLMLGTAFVMDGSAIGFLERIHRGVERLSMLDGRTTTQILRWDSFTPNHTEKLLIYGLAIWTLAVLCLTAASNVLARIIGQVLAIAAGITGILILFGQVAVPLQPSSSQRMILYGPLLGLLAFLPLEWFVRRHRKRNAFPPRWPLIFLFVLLPFVYSFGTGSNYWNTSPAAALFWGIAGSLLLFSGRDQTEEAALPAWTIIIQLPTAILLAAGLQWPYRQPQPARSFDGIATVGIGETKLVMPHDFATYLDEMRKILDTHGFMHGDPMIDLSGQSPGVIFAVGGQNIGQPWMIGGYPGSEELARKVLAYESCEALASSWILVEPNGPRSISTDVVGMSGLPFPSSYKIAGEIMTPAGAGGFAKPRRQIVYKPIDPPADIVNACRVFRG